MSLNAEVNMENLSGDKQKSIFEMNTEIQNHIEETMNAHMRTLENDITSDNDETEIDVNGLQTENVTQSLIGLTVLANVGNPPQSQKIHINFWTSNFWIVSKNYTWSRYIVNAFAQENSTSIQPTETSFALPLSDYRAKGVEVIDTVSFGDLTLENRKIKLAQKALFVFPFLRVNGVLGLAENDEGKSALGDLLQDAEEPVLTLYYNPLSNVFSKAVNSAFVTFGGSDKNLCKDDWKAVDAKSNPFWQVDVHGVSEKPVTDKSSPPNRGLFTNLLWVTLLPTNEFRKIVSLLDAVEVKRYTDVYVVTCDLSALPTLYFNINGQAIPLTPANYVSVGKGVCFLKLYPININISQFFKVHYVFGEPLIRSNCVQFSPHTHQLKFATPKALPLEY